MKTALLNTLRHKLRLAGGSVRRGWFFSYLLVLAVPLALCLLLYLYSYHVITRESERSYGSTLAQLRIDIDAYLTELQQVEEGVMLNEDVQRATMLSGTLDGNDRLQLRDAQANLLTLKLTHPNVSNLYVILNGIDSVIGSSGHMTQQMFYDLYGKNNPLSFEDWQKTMRQSYPVWSMLEFIDADGNPELWFLRSSLSSSIGNRSATIVVAIRKDLLEQRLAQFQWDTGIDLYAVGMDGSIVCRTDTASELDTELLALPVSDQFTDLHNQMVLVENSSFAGWRYILTLSKGLMMRATSQVQVFTWLGLVLCMLLGLLLSRRLTEANYQPLQSLVEQFVPRSGRKSLADKNEYEQLEYYVQKYYQERRDVQRALWNTERTLRQYFVYTMMQTPLSPAEVQRCTERYQLALDAPYYAVVLFSIDRLEESADSIEDGGVSLELTRFAMLNIFEEAAERFHPMTTDISTCAAIVGLPDTSDDSMASLEEDIRFTEQKMQEHFHVAVCAAIGGIHDGPAGISASYSEALEAMSYLLAGEDSDLIRYAEIRDARANYSFPRETERRMIDLVAAGNGEQTAQLVRQTFPLGETSPVRKPGVARCLAYDITSALIKGASQGGVEDFENVRFTNGEACDPDEMQRHLTRTAVTLCERVRLHNESASPNGTLCEEVRRYIHEHYADPDLNISQTGLRFNMTPAYLSNIFKRETGVSLLGYINTVRIEKAKELLCQGMAVAHIAAQTGFRDSSALIRVFKKTTGMTPGAYRTAHLGSAPGSPSL